MRILSALLIFASPALALTPAEIIIITNSNVPVSKELAEYYCQMRKVPKENIIAMALPKSEEITRVDYETQFRKPLQELLKTRKDAVKCILCMHGVPLRVGKKIPSPAEQAEADRMKTGLDAVKARAASPDPVTATAGKADLVKLETDIMKLEHRESYAAVDSELMLLWWPDNYSLVRWVMNPLNWQMPEAKRKAMPLTVMTARLDGPSPAIVRRMIDDAVAVEAEGLQGALAIDARGIAFDPKLPSENGGYGYGGYDESYRETAVLFQDKLAVTLDNKQDCFAPGSVKNVALYSGWYSHGKFIDCCTYAKGAVAWHLASSEATSLYERPATLWCPNLLQHGAAVTLGPVAEPYTVGFPKPAEFFGFLATGKYTLAEVNAKTMHLTSWQMTCLGDPLYTPFKNNPIIKESEIFASPKAGKSLLR